MDFEAVIALTQDEFDTCFFLQILNRNHSNVDVLRRQAEIFARQGNYDEALRLDQHLASCLPNDCVVRYNLACSLSMLGQLELAVESLRDAIELGYRDFARIESDSDLDNIRELCEYHELMASLYLESGELDSSDLDLDLEFDDDLF